MSVTVLSTYSKRAIRLFNRSMVRGFDGSRNNRHRTVELPNAFVRD